MPSCLQGCSAKLGFVAPGADAEQTLRAMPKELRSPPAMVPQHKATSKWGTQLAPLPHLFVPGWQTAHSWKLCVTGPSSCLLTGFYKAVLCWAALACCRNRLRDKLVLAAECPEANAAPQGRCGTSQRHGTAAFAQALSLCPKNINTWTCWSYRFLLRFCAPLHENNVVQVLQKPTARMFHQLLHSLSYI